MSKILTIQKPKILDELFEINDIYNEIILEYKLQDKTLQNDIIEDKNEHGFTIDSCIFRNVVFSNCSLPNVD